MSTGVRRFVALAAGVGIGILMVVVYLRLPPRQSDDIAMPANDATPEQVVTAYLDALNAHDCDTAQAVMTNNAQASAQVWCDDVAGLTDITVRHHLLERPEFSGHTAPDEIADVPVTFDLDWRLLHNDGSMDEGATTWGYLLVRHSPDAPWRIFDQGTG